MNRIIDKLFAEQEDLENALKLEGYDMRLEKWLKIRRKIIERFQRKLNHHDNQKEI